MPRELPFVHRRLAEEAVRQGMAAPVVMEAAAREWVALEGEETFPDYLVRREVLAGPRVEELAAALASEAGGEPAGEVLPGGEAARPSHPAEVIKGYRILERLGRGAMGSVYRAEQIGMNRTVALKILRRPLGENPEHVERLRREARLVGALDHPNIVRGLDVGQHGPYHYFVMEFVEGETLRDALKRRGVIPEAEALRLVEQITLALDHAHARGIVHRDVKPGNIIVTPDGTPKLTDYGLAKGPADFTLTQSGVTVGTPQYISPDQAHDPSGVDVQTDIYALGATAYHMVTGVPPHTSDTLAGLLTKVLYEKPRSARQVNPKVSPGASFLIEKMMAKQRRHRYREPRDVLRDLRALAAGRSIVPRDWAGDFEVQEARRRTRWIAGGAAALVVAAIGATVFLQLRSERETRRYREETATAALDAITRGETPRSRELWEARQDKLENFLRRPEFSETPAHAIAVRELQEAQQYLMVWGEESSYAMAAEGLAHQRKHREALLGMRDVGLPALEKKPEHRGREPAKALREAMAKIRLAGQQAAEDLARTALAGADRAPAVPRRTASLMEGDLAGVLDTCRREYLEDGDEPAAVQGLAAVVEDLGRARSSVEESFLGPGYRQTRERLLAGNDYASLEDELERIAARMQEDRGYQDVLVKLPGPAAEDFRGRIGLELEEARKANRSFLEGAVAGAGRLADRGEFDAALAGLDQAGNRSLKDLRGPVEALKREIAERRVAAEKAADEAVASFMATFMKYLEGRDLLLSRKRIGEAGGAQAAGGGRGMAEAVAGALATITLVDQWAFEPIRRRIREGGAFPLLQFDGENSSQPYIQASNVRLVTTDTAPVIVFDEPNQPNLKGSLFRLSLRPLLDLSGLSGKGLTDDQAFVKAALVLTWTGGTVEQRELEDTRRLLDLVRAEGRNRMLAPILDALQARADDLIAARVQVTQTQEKEAADTYEESKKALKAGDPIGAKRGLELLLFRNLATTRFAAENRRFIQDTYDGVLVTIRERKLASLFPGALIEELARGPAEQEGLTRITWSFDDEQQAKGFIPPDDRLPALYRILLDPPAANGGGGAANGRLVFLEGGDSRKTADSPLTLPCVFKRGMRIALRCRVHSDTPFYLEFCVVGNHVGVLTDDGKKTSGRGVYAWQSADWRDPDRFFPESYRHDFLPKDRGDLSRLKEPEGFKYFQFEAGQDYGVLLEWDRGRLKLTVDGREIWNVQFNPYFRDTPPVLRILSYRGGWIDDLSAEGVVDQEYLEKLVKRR